jgi:uncharacterized protein
MLQLRPSCECCDKALPPESTEARICSFECTFCAACAEGTLAGKCPNCGGELVARPRRPAAKLGKFPASTEKVLKQHGCDQTAYLMAAPGLRKSIKAGMAEPLVQSAKGLDY